MDRKIFLGIGIGIIIGTIAMLGRSYELSMSKDKIEQKARSYGMHYDDECKAIYDKDVEK